MSLVVRELDVAVDGHPILRGLALTVECREVVAVLGPSGSGKSTLLRVIAGLHPPDRGTVTWDGHDLAGVPAHQRRIGLVFQDEQLFPHLDVAGNVGFGLRMAGRRRHEVSERVRELLELVGLGGFERRSVDSLSGGEAKRVALARSLAPEPVVLLLDEPLTGLDAELHDRLADETRRVLVATGTTAILVTHDRDEAATIADRVVDLRTLQAR